MHYIYTCTHTKIHRLSNSRGKVKCNVAFFLFLFMALMSRVKGGEGDIK